MSSQSRHFISSRPQALDGNITGAIGQGSETSQFPRRAHARPVNIPERRIWSSVRPKFHIRDSSGSSQGGSSTKSSGGGGSTTSEGRVHTVSPYGSFFVEDMEIDGPAGGGHSHGRGGGGWTRDTTVADLNRAIYHQTSARRPPPPSSQNDRHRSPIRVVAPGGLFETTTDPTYSGIMPGALPVPAPPSRDIPWEVEGTSSTLVATSAHRSKSNPPISWNREYRNHSNSRHKSQAYSPRVVTGTAPPPGSSLSNPDRQNSRGVTRTSLRR